MKTKHILLLIVVSLFFVACSKDKKDEPQVQKVNVKMVEGVYNGSIVMTVRTPGAPVDTKIELRADGDDTVMIMTPNLGSGPMAMKSMTLEHVKVTTTDNKTYKLVETKIDEQINNVKYVGSISGTIDANGKAKIDYSVKPGAMPMSIKFAFTGEKEKNKI